MTDPTATTPAKKPSRPRRPTKAQMAVAGDMLLGCRVETDPLRLEAIETVGKWLVHEGAKAKSAGATGPA